MAYNNTVPQANQTIAETQQPILANFQYIQNAIKLDHAWQGSVVGTEAAGYHDQVSMPNNQLTNPVLPAGIAVQQCAANGNIYAWNGTQNNPISGVTASGTLNFTVTGGVPDYINVLTVPSESSGFVLIQMYGQFSVSPDTCVPVSFFSKSGSLYITPPYINNKLTFRVSGLTLQAATYLTPYTAAYKSIYWPI